MNIQVLCLGEPSLLVLSCWGVFLFCFLGGRVGVGFYFLYNFVAFFFNLLKKREKRFHFIQNKMSLGKIALAASKGIF